MRGAPGTERRICPRRGTVPAGRRVKGALDKAGLTSCRPQELSPPLHSAADVARDPADVTRAGDKYTKQRAALSPVHAHEAALCLGPLVKT